MISNCYIVIHYSVISFRFIYLVSLYTGLDCYFNKNEECYWTWDSDNFTEVHESDHKPGQNGFIQADGEDIRRYAGKWEKKFFGPYWGPINRKYAGKNI